MIHTPTSENYTTATLVATSEDSETLASQFLSPVRQYKLRDQVPVNAAEAALCATRGLTTVHADELPRDPATHTVLTDHVVVSLVDGEYGVFLVHEDGRHLHHIGATAEMLVESDEQLLAMIAAGHDATSDAEALAVFGIFVEEEE